MHIHFMQTFTSNGLFQKQAEFHIH